MILGYPAPLVQVMMFYAMVRHKIEDALWTDDMTTLEKLCAIADYINQTTHYPFTDTVTKEYNPTFREKWSIDVQEQSTVVKAEKHPVKNMDVENILFP